MLPKIKNKSKMVQYFAWGLSALVMIIVFYGWGESWRWRFGNLSAYGLFPLLGLLAFSLMWSHYIVSVFRQVMEVSKEALKKYIEVTSALVLMLILLHPGILAWQLWRDGLGLPPGSAKLYVGQAMYWAVVLAIVSLVVFLTYELRRKFADRPWWIGVVVLTDLAMFGILIHSLALGSQLQTGWMRGLWYLYGVSLVPAMIYLYYRRAAKPNISS